MKPDAQDRRERIVNDIESDECNQTEAAEKYAVSLSFVQKRMRRVRDSGRCEAKPHRGGLRRARAPATAVIRTTSQAHPAVTWQALCEQVNAQRHIQSDDSLMSRELKLLKLTLKKSAARL